RGRPSAGPRVGALQGALHLPAARRRAAPLSRAARARPRPGLCAKRQRGADARAGRLRTRFAAVRGSRGARRRALLARQTRHHGGGARGGRRLDALRPRQTVGRVAAAQGWLVLSRHLVRPPEVRRLRPGRRRRGRGQAGGEGCSRRLRRVCVARVARQRRRQVA
ncbi:hypothetical protein EMIHUDRAFT_443211, partial [Emiliania huxleyi CCMP1516]|uniref:Uncharacterized protein n=2 Tax=Emiliania huxleyi TaxID=2903 RepID=A0A0D3JV79_EMIH1